MKLTLISPRNKISAEHKEKWDTEFYSLLFGRKRYNCANLALPTIAALTPPDVEISILDENVEDINFNTYTDLVGITVSTFLAPRAYEIADEFRKRDITVVLGGIHPSMLPDEAIQYADAVVIGEAEGVWENLVNDYKKGKMRQFYQSSQRPDLSQLPIPRWDLLKNDLYSIQSIQTTRGCPYDCEFCSVKAFSGAKFRCKPIEKILKEIETVISFSKKRLFFTDDNLIGNKKMAKDLLEAFIPMKISYHAQVSLDLANDEELLKLLAKSGCNSVIIGFESVSGQVIKQMNKSYSNKVEEYKQNIRKIQSYGIGIQGSFMFGCDSDDLSVFEKTVNFIQDVKLESVVFCILTPFPGTKLYNRLTSENRILHRDWGKYDTGYVCYRPKLMSPEVLENGWVWAQQKIYSFDNIFERLRALWGLWNESSARLEDRITPIVRNLGYNDRAYSYPLAVEPKKFAGEKNEYKIF